MKKFIIALTLFFISLTNVSALDIHSSNYIMYNLDNNVVVMEKDQNEKVDIASLTKIMTALVAIENIDDLNEKVVITNEMLKGLIEADLAVVGLKAGQETTYEDLLYATLLASGADAVRGLAFGISGNEEKFVKLMNDKAKKIGLKNTHFVNADGLDADNHYSTVSDVALLLKEALKNETFKTVFTTLTYTFKDGSKKVNSTLVTNSKRMGIDLSYIQGAKTGFTDKAGRCLASIAFDEENKINYLLVTVKAPADAGKNYHVVDAENIYTYVFDNYKNYTLATKNKKITTIKTKYSSKEEVDLVSNKEVLYYTNEYDKSKIETKFIGPEAINFRAKKDSVIGKVEIKYDGKVVDTVDAILKEEIDFSLWIFIKENIIVISIGIVVLITLIVFLLKNGKKIRRRRKRK